MTFKVLLFILGLAGGFGVGWYTKSGKVVEKVVEKIVEKEKVITKTVTKRVTQPNGTITEVIHNDAKIEKGSDALRSFEATPVRSSFAVSLMAEVDELPGKPTYRIGIDYRLIGPLWLGVFCNYQLRSIGLGARMEF